MRKVEVGKVCKVRKAEKMVEVEVMKVVLQVVLLGGGGVDGGGGGDDDGGGGGVLKVAEVVKSGKSVKRVNMLKVMKALM